MLDEIKYPGVYIQSIPGDVRPIYGVSTAITAFIGYTSRGPVNKAVLVHSWRDYENEFGKLSRNSQVSYAVRQFFINGGTNAYIVRVVGKENRRTPIGTEIVGDYGSRTGIYALRDVDIFNIMAIPQTVVLSDEVAREVIAYAIRFCESMRAFYLVDFNKDCNRKTIIDWISKLGPQKNAATFFPQVRIADPLSHSRLKNLPTSGTIAGLIARIDANRGVWKAAAGIEATLVDVKSISVTFSDDDAHLLNQHGINCLRGFPNVGIVCWGARTLQRADAPKSEWKYIPVRRTALYIEESLYRGTKWAVFESNSETLWTKLQSNVGAFMQRLFRLGALQGSKPEEAYFVKCDNQTTTRSDINLGIVNIIVGFAPLKPAEFIVIKIRQRALPAVR
jgi:phage tail sheath protein FI